MVLIDGYISGREIVAGLRAELSHLKPGQRAAFGRAQIAALEACGDKMIHLPAAGLLPAWRALQAAFRLEYTAGFVRDLVPRDMSRWFLISAADFNAKAADLFEAAGARLVADVIVPETVMNELAKRRS